MAYEQTIEAHSGTPFPQFIVLEGEKIDWQEIYLDWYQSIDPADPHGFRILKPGLKAKVEQEPCGKNPFGAWLFRLTVESDTPFTFVKEATLDP